MKLHRFFWLAAFGLSLMPAPLVAAQDAGTQAPDTDQTDQQEDDWRNQNRVGSSNPFDPRPNSSNQGWGVNMPQMDPVDQLPEESRRHLAQMRTQAITSADLENPDFENIAYEPSDTAQGDPDLMAREQAAWEDILADMQAAMGTGGGGSQPDAQPAVMAGQGTGTGGGSGMQPTTMSGGGNQSAAEMLAQMGQAGGQQAGQGGSSGSTQASQGGAQTSAADMLRQMGQGAGSAAGAGAGQSAAQAEGGGTQDSGSGQSGGGESAEAGSQAAGEGQSDGQQGDADGAGADGDGSDAGQEGADSGDAGAETDAGAEAETPPRPTPSFGSTQTSQSGTQTSAGDFLKSQPETEED